MNILTSREGTTSLKDPKMSTDHILEVLENGDDPQISKKAILEFIVRKQLYWETGVNTLDYDQEVGEIDEDFEVIHVIKKRFNHGCVKQREIAIEQRKQELKRRYDERTLRHAQISAILSALHSPDEKKARRGMIEFYARKRLGLEINRVLIQYGHSHRIIPIEGQIMRAAHEVFGGEEVFWRSLQLEGGLEKILQRKEQLTAALKKKTKAKVLIPLALATALSSVVALIQWVKEEDQKVRKWEDPAKKERLISPVRSDYKSAPAEISHVLIPQNTQNVPNQVKNQLRQEEVFQGTQNISAQGVTQLQQEEDGETEPQIPQIPEIKPPEKDPEPPSVLALTPVLRRGDQKNVPFPEIVDTVFPREDFDAQEGDTDETIIIPSEETVIDDQPFHSEPEERDHNLDRQESALPPELATSEKMPSFSKLQKTLVQRIDHARWLDNDTQEPDLAEIHLEVLLLQDGSIKIDVSNMLGFVVNHKDVWEDVFEAASQRRLKLFLVEKEPKEVPYTAWVIDIPISGEVMLDKGIAGQFFPNGEFVGHTISVGVVDMEKETVLRFRDVAAIRGTKN